MYLLKTASYSELNADKAQLVKKKNWVNGKEKGEDFICKTL